jgi:hypothetical protein
MPATGDLAILSVMRMKYALVAGCLALTTGILMGCGAGGQLLNDVKVEPTTISPNGDGQADLARISYRLTQGAQVSIYLTDGAGKRYTLRDAVERTASPAPYELLFNGVSGGRLIPNGEYTWHVDVANSKGAQTATGKLTITNADLPFPKISEFTVSSPVLSPNRDAIADHVYINVGLLSKASLSVYVVGSNGFRYEVQRSEGLRRITTDDELEPGRYNYDYDGGIDLGADPPADGEYALVATSEDKIGQRDTVTTSLTITQSGRPVAEIVVQPDGRSVEWQAKGPKVVRAPNEDNFITMAISDTLYFTMAVKNVGLVPIRTGGPFDPNDCYDMRQNRYSKGYIQEPGAFRVGVDYETNPGTDHPWRWAVGTLDDLDVVMNNGTPLYYLAPGKQVVVRGCIRMTFVPPRNPFSVFASLIQEDVEILAINSHVSPVTIQLITP